MKKIALIISIISSVPACASDFDSTVKWIQELPSDSALFGNRGLWNICSRRVEVNSHYSRPYGIESLHWNNAFMKVGFGGYGITGGFDSYGFGDYYVSNSYELGFALEMTKFVAVCLAGRYERESFLNNGKFDGTEIDTRAAFRTGKAMAVLGIDGVTLKEKYVSPAKSDRLWGAATWLVSDNIALSGSVRQFENGRRRWLFAQRIILSRSANLSVGLLNRPDVIFGRINIGYGSFNFDLAYYSIGHLRDTVVLGLDFGRNL